MSDILRLLIRMISITLGFFIGCLAAGLAYAFLARLVVPDDFGRFSELELTVTLVVGVFGVASLFARAVLLPAFAVIAVFEFWRRRDWLSYALAGRRGGHCADGHRLPDGSRFHRPHAAGAPRRSIPPG
jgi:hypothetical protein